MQRSTEKLLASLLVGCLGLSAEVSFAQVLYVDDDQPAPMAATGASWATAFKGLQGALNVASGGGITEIRVGQGTYFPDRAPPAMGIAVGDREASFELLDDLTIRGGYAGLGAADPDERDPDIYETILSGNINLGGLETDNSYHVVTADGVSDTAVIAGFIIERGYADTGALMYGREGADMLIIEASPTIDGCVFRAGDAGNYGGAVSIRSLSNPAFTACRFIGNEADVGGAVYIYDASASFESSEFRQNHAGAGGGGAIYLHTASPTIRECLFRLNSAATDGGALYLLEHSGPKLRECVFLSNSAADRGGAIWDQESGTTGNHVTELVRCRFNGNTATDGGAFYGEGGGVRSVLVSCLFRENFAQHDGGGVWDREKLYLADSIFDENNAGNLGGGLYLEANAAGPAPPPRFVNNTFYGNGAIDGGGVATAALVNWSIENSILWQNNPDQIEQVAVGFLGISHSDIENAYDALGVWDGSLGADLGGNIDADPQFLDAPAGDFHLGSGSPCIDTGDNAALMIGDPGDLDEDLDEVEDLPLDYDLNDRVVDGDADGNEDVDMGALEYQAPGGGPGNPDQNGDGMVDVADLLVLLGGWGQSGHPADLNGDGTVDVEDLMILLAAWGATAS